MKNLIRSALLAPLFVATCMAYGAIPAVKITVSDASGKAAFKGVTNASGTFATPNLKPGNYVVQFNSTSGELKGNHYALVVSAGKTKVAANAVPGEKFAKGGVAMKLEVGAGLNVTGQVSAETKNAMKNGKKMVWIKPQLGSNMPGHWAEEGSAEAVAAKAAGNLSPDGVRQMQDGR